MRLWSLSPKYLDRSGLLAVWREGLLAKKVLEGKTKGYKNHPQLDRFKESRDRLSYIKAYLSGLVAEAERRGYNFQAAKAGLLKKKLKTIKVNSGQVAYEFSHLLRKLESRNYELYLKLKKIKKPSLHPLFRAVKGGIEKWEKIK
jgi:hypothetical protein